MVPANRRDTRVSLGDVDAALRILE